MRRLYPLIAILFLAAGCAEGSDEPLVEGNNTQQEACEDRDDDGYLGLSAQCEKGSDCDDSDPEIYPGAEEVCGDGRDNDCRQGDEPCEQDCIDHDGDRYGDGEGCLGPDCDDTDPNVNPRQEEVCGNGTDDDCDGIDNPCPTDCTDADGDGFGVAGRNSDCPSTGDDCDDTNELINPDAAEACNGVDDNCDGTIDECSQQNASCTGTETTDRCVVAIGGPCQRDGECGEGARCDTTVSECRRVEGESCTDAAECLEGFACDGGVCTGDFCAVNTCSGDLGHCDSDAQRCVECRHWDANANYGDDDCPSGEGCTLEGFCGVPVQISNSDPVPNHEPLTNDIYEMSLVIADCWMEKRGGSNDLCAALYVSSDVDSPITESEMDAAFYDDRLLDFLTQDRYNALEDLWGHGLFNLKNIDWRSDPQPDTLFEYCVWYDTTSTDEVFVDKCANYTP
jgi:hypothetical protein